MQIKTGTPYLVNDLLNILWLITQNIYSLF